MTIIHEYLLLLKLGYLLCAVKQAHDLVVQDSEGMVEYFRAVQGIFFSEVDAEKERLE